MRTLKSVLTVLVTGFVLTACAVGDRVTVTPQERSVTMEQARADDAVARGCDLNAYPDAIQAGDCTAEGEVRTVETANEVDYVARRTVRFKGDPARVTRGSQPAP